jgi:hypothetical protein
MYDCVSEQKSENISRKFEKLWSEELLKSKPSLSRVILKVYIYKVIVVGILFSMVELPCQ